ncbi:hypothetical protein [Halobacteriovorax sp. HLS]|uniref:hypothetical protein n=1 Tax=Halobacteriovorax sp. HLS TaxID=2234000 RepID=UPI0013E2BDE9|nr:hypothetical protein [Halobacteriovorax sp. HLS]
MDSKKIKDKILVLDVITERERGSFFKWLKEQEAEVMDKGKDVVKTLERTVEEVLG